MKKLRTNNKQTKKTNKTLITMMLIISMFLIPAAQAEIPVIEDWFEYDSTFKIETDVYDLLIVHPNIETLRLKKNDFTTIVSLEQCRTNQGYTFCYQEYSFDSNKVNIDSRGNLMPAIKIKITRTEEAIEEGYKIQINSNIPGNKFINEEQEATITIKNNGKNLRDAQLRITAPINTITSRQEFIQVSNNLRKDININMNQEQEHKFNYKPKEGENQFLYELIKDNEVIQSGTLNANGIKPYEITVNTVAQSDIQKILDLNINIKNNHPTQELILNNLTMQGPINFQYTAAQGFTLRGLGRYEIPRTTINPGAQRNYIIRYKPIFAGTYKFQIDANLDLYEKYREEQEKEITIINEGINPEFYLTRKDISLNANTDLILNIRNDHPQLIFRDFEAIIESEIFQGRKTQETINSKQTVNIFNERIEPPQIEENKEYQIKATIRYKNEAGQTETINIYEVLKVTGNGTLLKLQQDANPKTAKIGDEIIIEVYVENLKENMFNEINIKDEHSQTTQTIVGAKQTQTTLLGKQGKQAYLYKIKIPENPTSKELKITTTAQIPSLNYTQTTYNTITIDEDIDEITQEEETTQEETTPEEEITQGETTITEGKRYEANFLKRMVQNIEQFFTRLFGKK